GPPQVPSGLKSSDDLGASGRGEGRGAGGETCEGEASRVSAGTGPVGDPPAQAKETAAAAASARPRRIVMITLPSISLHRAAYNLARREDSRGQTPFPPTRPRRHRAPAGRLGASGHGAGRPRPIGCAGYRA